MSKLKLTKAFLLLFAPLLTLAGTTESPSLAATLAGSRGIFEMDTFSHRPLSVSTITDTTTFVAASDGQVAAVADANANFVNGAPQPFASNFSLSTVSGTGNSYFGQADSFAAVIGYIFFIGGGETFSFNFNAALNLATSIDNSQFELAVANGSIVLELYDTTNSRIGSI